MTKLVSVVVPAYNEAGNIEALVDRVESAVPAGYALEIVVVDDGSSDETAAVVRRVARRHREVGLVSFSRNFGHQAALRAGLREASGDCVVTMDADLQHPPAMLPDLLRAWEGGAEIVYTRRIDGAGTSLFKRLTSTLFYRVLNAVSGLALEAGAADFRLMDRKVVDAINELPEPDLFLRGFVSWCGFRSTALDYRPAPRFSGASKYSWRKMVALALHGITQFSIKPLRVADVLGLVCATAGVGYGSFAVWRHFVDRQTVSGWTSVVVSVLILGGVQLTVLGIIGEYLGRTFLQSKGRPDYIVRDRVRSSAAAIRPVPSTSGTRLSARYRSGRRAAR